MSLYPSLEDMMVDQMIKAQQKIESQFVPTAPILMSTSPSAPGLTPPEYGHDLPGQLYPALGDYMGLEFSAEMIEANMPEYKIAYRESMEVSNLKPSGTMVEMVAPISGESLGLQRAQVSNGIRELTLCKDKNGKIGLRVHAVNNGIFVCLVTPDSPASKAGLRFGDQILNINGTSVAGYSMDQVHKIFRNASNSDIKVIVRDRPFERTITMHKDNAGSIGFQFKEGKIIAIVKDSSAARNGVLTDHQILEVNGKNVVGMKDKEIVTEIANGTNVVTITVIPSYIYDHMIKKMSGSLFTVMDHSVPNL